MKKKRCQVYCQSRTGVCSWILFLLRIMSRSTVSSILHFFVFITLFLLFILHDQLFVYYCCHGGKAARYQHVAKHKWATWAGPRSCQREFGRNGGPFAIVVPQRQQKQQPTQEAVVGTTQGGHVLPVAADSTAPLGRQSQYQPNLPRRRLGRVKKNMLVERLGCVYRCTNTLFLPFFYNY